MIKSPLLFDELFSNGIFQIERDYPSGLDLYVNREYYVGWDRLGQMLAFLRESVPDLFEEIMKAKG